MPRLDERVWEASGPSYLRGREDSRGFRYSAYVPDPIRDLDPGLPPAVAATAEQAAVATKNLDLSLGVDHLEPIARLLLRAESVASSRIEGLRLSHRRLEEALVAPGAARKTALSIVRNIDAMARAVQIGIAERPLIVGDLLDIHSTLLDTEQDRAVAGRLREEQNWIGGGNTPRRAEFIPPPHELVPSLVEDLIGFCNRTDLPAIVQAAVAHAQFETIHPFVDGNGRTGRCLVHVILRRRRLSERVTPPISVVLAANSTEYVQGLTAYRQEDVAGWCGVFAQATRIAAERGVELAASLAELEGIWQERAGKPRAGSSARRLVEGLAAHPILSVASASELLGVSDEAARLALTQLERTAVVKPITLGTRNRAWAADEIFDLLDELDMTMATPLGGERASRPAPTRHLRTGGRPG